MQSHNQSGGFCGALQRAPPVIPQCLLRRLSNKETYGVGKIKVTLRVTDSLNSSDMQHFMSIDKKKRQVTLNELVSLSSGNLQVQDRCPMVSAPKMFAFDNIFTTEDQQSTVCASILSELIPAVLEGSDGCVVAIGYPSCGQTQTMLGSFAAPSDLGAVPCAISWLYSGINDRRQSSGARFSVRVSALGISATKPNLGPKDLLASHATESDESPGIYLRDDLLGGPTELLAPTAERAALFLDAALAVQSQLCENEIDKLESAMIFTLHVYQYSLTRKGGVVGGRSRLHLIDLGGCSNRNGGLSLSTISNILLAILSGHRHPPNKDHPLTPLLKDCLAPISCHVSLIAHVQHSQSHTDALTTIQLASRIHRMRRRKHRFPIQSEKLGNILLRTSGSSTGASSGADPSSSELSADTVIYMGPTDDATDGEHPPIYLPSLSNNDNRGVINKVLKNSNLDTRQIQPKPKGPTPTKITTVPKKPQNSTLLNQKQIHTTQLRQANNDHIPSTSVNSHTKVGGGLRHPLQPNLKGTNYSTLKGSPIRRPSLSVNPTNEPFDNYTSPLRKITEEQWVDGPRVSRAKVAEARHLMREVNHVKKCETWIDGPKSHSTNLLIASNLPPSCSQTQGYGFMDAHKKSMIRKWVETQTSQVFQTPFECLSPTHISQNDHQVHITNNLLYKKQKSMDDTETTPSNTKTTQKDIKKLTQSVSPDEEASFNEVNNLGDKHPKVLSKVYSQSLFNYHMENKQSECEEDEDSGPSEVPPALPLIEPLSSREISNENLQRMRCHQLSRESLFQTNSQSHRQDNFSTHSSPHFSQRSVDCGLQVTEEDIARTMSSENPSGAVSLSGSTSFFSNFHVGEDSFSDCVLRERTRNQFDQLARLREIFTSQLEMAEVTPSISFQNACDIGSVYSEPAYCFNTVKASLHSEPVYEASKHKRPISSSSSKCSLSSMHDIMKISEIDKYSLRQPDGASDPNLAKMHESEILDQKSDNEMYNIAPMVSASKELSEENIYQNQLATLPINVQIQLPLLPLHTLSESYDSGQDSCTPRTSKHSGISRRAESGYHSVATARDSDESSLTSGLSKERHKTKLSAKKSKSRTEKSLCKWLMNPFTCTYPETEAEISDF